MVDRPIDGDAVGRYLGVPVELGDGIAGGGSKPSRRAVVAGRPAVLALGPGPGALETAHDLAREHACLVALAGSSVPVAPVLGYCDDPSVAGAPFLVTGLVDGACLLTDPGARIEAAPLAYAAVDVLADLHAVEVPAGAVPAHPGSYLERQVHRWRRQLAATPTSGRLGDLAPLADWLLAHLPASEDRTLVHGDFGFHNLLVEGDRIVAVIDWELATMGDPLADLVFFTKSWGAGALARNPANDAVALVPGAPDRAALEARYEGRTGRSPAAHQPFYDVFSLWRSIGIREGLYARSGRTRFEADAPGFVRVARRLAGID